MPGATGGGGRHRSLVAISVVVVASYATIVVYLTWPLGAAPDAIMPLTMLSARTDVPLVAWSLAHQTLALVGWVASFTDGGIYHPTNHSLFYGEAGSGALALFAPVFLATGNPTLAINVVFLGGVTLTAAAIHGATVRFTRSHASGAVAGATFLATPWVLWTWMAVAPNYAVLFYLPFVVLVVAGGPTTWRSTIALAVLVTLQSLSSAYIGVATCAPLAALAAARIVRRSSRADGLRILVALGSAMPLLAVAYAPYALVRRDNPNLAEQTLYHLHLVSPALPWDLIDREWPTALPLAAWAVIGLAVLCRVVARRSGVPVAPGGGWRPALSWTLIGVAIALPPTVTVAGRLVVLPQRMWAPLYQAIRAPDRLGVAALVAGSMLAGVAFSELAVTMRRWHPSLVPACAGIVVVAMATSYATHLSAPRRSHVSWEPYPTFTAPLAEGPLYAIVARRGGTLLELPIAPSPVPHMDAMFRAIAHRQPLVNGYSGYWPATFAERMRLACLLPDAAALARLRQETGVELILVHTRVLGLARRSGGRVPYACPPGSPFDSPGSEQHAWLEAATPGARDDLELLATDDKSNLLFAVR